MKSTFWYDSFGNVIHNIRDVEQDKRECIFLHRKERRMQLHSWLKVTEVSRFDTKCALYRNIIRFLLFIFFFYVHAHPLGILCYINSKIFRFHGCANIERMKQLSRYLLSVFILAQSGYLMQAVCHTGSGNGKNFLYFLFNLVVQTIR